MAQEQQLVEPIPGYILSPVRKSSQKWFVGGAEGGRKGKENTAEKGKGKGKTRRERRGRESRRERGMERVIGSILSVKAFNEGYRCNPLL